MALVVNSNVAALNAEGKLAQTTLGLSRVFEKLSSGLRINRAADDAAGLGVAEGLDSEIRSFKQAMRNANDGISVIQTAESATNEVANIIKRMRELAIQSASESLATDERNYVQNEFEQLSTEVDRIAQTTSFNGISLTQTASHRALAMQVGVNNTANDRISVTFYDLRATTLGVTTDPNVMALDTAVDAQAAITRFDTALTTLNSYRSNYGAFQNRLESVLRNISNYTENLSSAKSRILDADFASETAQLAKFQILQQSGVAVLGQANAVSQAALRLLG